MATVDETTGHTLGDERSATDEVRRIVSRNLDDTHSVTLPATRGRPRVPMPYPRAMSYDSPPGAAWHSQLASRDKAAHQRMADFTHDHEFDLLRQRFDAVTAELVVLRAAVDRRNVLLHEQSLALVERDTRIHLLEDALRSRSSRPSIRLALMRRGRATAGRLVRIGRPGR